MKNRLMMILQKNIRNQQLKNTLILKPTRPFGDKEKRKNINTLILKPTQTRSAAEHRIIR